MQKINKIHFAFLLSVLFLVVACSRNPVTGKKEFMLISEKQEMAMGAGADPAIVAQYGLYQDAEIQSFINAKGQAMAKISHRPNLNYSFKVLDSPVINAFAVPGGYVYFTRGILAHFNNEAEFAGVLGHEIGHVTARHSAQQYSKSMLAQVGLIAGMVAAPKFAQYANSAQQGLGLLFLKFGRDDESQSDRLGVEYSTKIGYDAHHMANFFNTLKRMRTTQGGEEIPTFMSTHPDPGDRFNKVHEQADYWQKGLKATNLKEGRDSYLRMIDGLVYGEDPRQGYFEKGYFYHPELRFVFPYPSSWQKVNAPSQVQMGAKDGKAMMIFTLAKEQSLTQAAQAFIQENQLTQVESRNVTVNGMQAIMSVADQAANQQNQSPAIRILTYFISYNGKIYKFHGLSETKDFYTYRNTFEQTMTGFNKLTDQAKINVKPDVIKIETAKQTASLQFIMKSFNMPEDKMEALSLLNGMKLTDKVQQGTLIKTLVKGQ